MNTQDAAANLNRCNCNDRKQTLAHDWNERGCAYRAWYEAQQNSRQDQPAKRAQSLGFWKS